MEQLIIWSHVAGGGTVLILGLLNFLNRKGKKSHRVIGKIYVGAMWWICLTALLIISFYRFSFFLMVIAVLTFYASFIGIRVLNRKEPGSELWIDWAVSIATATFGIGLFFYGIYLFFPFTQFHVLGLLSVLFGFFTARAALLDLVFFYKKNPATKTWWLSQHVSAMSGSYIAAITAFAVQNGSVFFSDGSLRWLTWILPTLILTPVVSWIQKKHTRSSLNQVRTESASAS